MNIQTFIDQLSATKQKDYTSLLKNFDFDTIDFSEIENWLPNCYTRNCFFRNQEVELILICWDKGQQTAIHNHDGENCWVYLLEGEMEEEYYRLNSSNELRLYSSKRIRSNQLTKSDKTTGFHRLRVGTEKPALSLHLYAKPIYKNLTYDENTGIFIEKKLSYTTYKPLKLV